MKTEIVARMGDVDIFGIVYWVNYFRYFSIALEDLVLPFYKEVTGDISKIKFTFPIVDAHCNFKAPAKLGDVLEVETSLVESKEKTLKFEYKIRRKYDNKLLANGHTINVAVDRESWKPVEIPREFLDWLLDQR